MSLFDLQDVCIAIGSIATLDLPMVVDLIGIYGLKGPYCTLTTTDWFLQALSVIPRGSWGDVARRFTMIRWAVISSSYSYKFRVDQNQILEQWSDCFGYSSIDEVIRDSRYLPTALVYSIAMVYANSNGNSDSLYQQKGQYTLITLFDRSGTVLLIDIRLRYSIIFENSTSIYRQLFVRQLAQHDIVCLNGSDDASHRKTIDIMTSPSYSA
ncbi:hypothetical protein F511_42973 [Dorcoceras hygrometricum]|uniref:Uncharacterized protein n=1 Tax=Dorcoceras hygrometricum TaxID=472368 RepID=A0A2Z7BE94_9LAMI|nr:hypothetical protein F511_42973 [Dorcoceras hygrometricum]